MTLCFCVLQNTLSIVIPASDNPAGVFSFLTASLTLSEDGPSSGELEVRRTSSLVGVVIITWEALYTDGADPTVPLADILLNTRGSITFGDNSATPNANILLQLRANSVSRDIQERYRELLIFNQPSSSNITIANNY